MLAMGTGPGSRSIDELAARAQAGDPASFEELVVRLREPLARFVGRRLPRAVDAEDAVQETFLRAFDHLDRYDRSRRFTTWLFAIGKHVAADHRDADRRRDDRERRGARLAAVAADVAANDGDGGAV